MGNAMAGNEVAPGALIPGHGWKCLDCGEENGSDSLQFPVMHEVLTGHKNVEPKLRTIVAWGRVMGR
jgi:hypothetical protein